MRLFRWWFNGKTVERHDMAEAAKSLPEISVGSLWVLKGDKGDPFPSKFRSMGKLGAARILDVKDGWVRYSMGPPAFSLFPDNRQEVGEFLRMYEPWEVA